MPLFARCLVKAKEKYFMAKYMSADTLLKVNAATYCKFKLQLQYRNNKSYSSVTVTQVHTINTLT